MWSQASQVIQSYGTSTAGYGLVFLAGHFFWAFSLMFLFSGRGYWQELIESILWFHGKIKLTNSSGIGVKINKSLEFCFINKKLNLDTNRNNVFDNIVDLSKPDSKL